jgi:hypothetical protein
MGACYCPAAAAHDATLRCGTVACRYLDHAAVYARHRREGAAAERFLRGRYGSLSAAVQALRGGSLGRTKQTTRSPYAELALESRRLAPTRASARLRRAAAAADK